MPQPDARNQVSRLTDFVLRNQTTWMPTNGPGKFEKVPASGALIWKGAPFVTPHLEPLETDGRSFLFGGTFTTGPTNNPPPSELLQQFMGRTNLVFYDWERTGCRSDELTYILQFSRLVVGRAQMQIGGASLPWLKTAAASLGNCVTEVTQTGPNQLALVRKSGLGFSALELHVLCDWLESPDFPSGLHSFLPAPVEE
jgi:hypothetical protein